MSLPLLPPLRFCDKLTCEYRLSLASGSVLAHPAPAPSHSGFAVVAGILMLALAVGCCCLCLMDDYDACARTHRPAKHNTRKHAARPAESQD
jgi:hypothetical protein